MCTFHNYILPYLNSATCTFDSGLCGWLQSTQDDIDWTTGQGITPSRHTGPHTDHTGNIGGL